MVDVKYTDTDFLTIEEQKTSIGWPPEYCSSIGLIPYIKRLGDKIVGLEIGTEKGESAYVILDRCPNVRKLYTIDHYKRWINWNGTVPEDIQKKFKAIADKNLAPFERRVKQLVGSSPEMLSALYGPDTFDFVYIDGSPSKFDTMSDLKVAWSLLKKKGLLMGHNYQFGEVNEAVHKFRKDEKISSPINKSTNGTYFWYKQ